MSIPKIVYNDRLLNTLGFMMKIGGITLWPWIILREDYKRPLKYYYKKNKERVIRHESIHIKQQVELLVIPFYILYLLNFILNIVTFNGNPYKNICFEKEAYENEMDLDYLKKRKFWAWRYYIFKK